MTCEELDPHASTRICGAYLGLPKACTQYGRPSEPSYREPRSVIDLEGARPGPGSSVQFPVNFEQVHRLRVTA